MKNIFLLLLILTWHPTEASVPDSAQTKNIAITGNGFVFTLKEPVGWICDTKLATEYKANAILYANEDSIKSGGALIQLSVFYKQDEFTDKDLEENVNSYKETYSNLQESNIDIVHPRYRTYGKLEYVPGDFYQYIIYLNPGDNYKYGLSAGMNVYKRPATNEELRTFKEIVSTLMMLKG